MKMRVVTCTAPINIAVIKYWGKRDEKLILPLNDSLSFTLSQDVMCAQTTIAVSPKFTEDKFWLNGKEESLDNPRIVNCLKAIRRRATKRKLDEPNEDIMNWRLHICSENNFPTAAGLASSAAGYACLVYTLGQLYDVDGDLSVISRQGSGSACRSMYGGLVRWHKGKLEDGTDSFARQLEPASQWPDLHVIICVVSDSRKKTSSTLGMQQSVKTSSFLKFRVKDSIDHSIDVMLKAVKDNDWSSFCDVTMADSNQLHAVCLDTSPPCVYMNDTSHAITNVVYAYNQFKIDSGKSSQKICYTFDAGPNACLFVPGEVVSEVMTLLVKVFPPDSDHSASNEYIKGEKLVDAELSQDLLKLTPTNDIKAGRLKYFIHTHLGGGPKLLSDKLEDQRHLIDVKTGLPSSSNQENKETETGLPSSFLNGHSKSNQENKETDS